MRLGSARVGVLRADGFPSPGRHLEAAVGGKPLDWTFHDRSELVSWRELEGVELPCAVRITAVDVAHMACDDAPRNQGGLTVACCGEPLKGHLEPGEPEASDVLCPRCPSIAPGECACWGIDMAGRTTG